MLGKGRKRLINGSTNEKSSSLKVGSLVIPHSNQKLPLA
jgi:hypothetical protein